MTLQLDLEQYAGILLSTLLWREARNQGVATLRILGWTVRNRVLRPSWWGHDWVSVILQPLQYSSMTHAGDANLVKFPLKNDVAYLGCLDVASEIYNLPAGGGVDLAQGCTHYFDKSLDGDPPSWAAKMTHVFDSGDFHFYK